MGMFDSDEPFDPDLSSKERWAEVPEPIRKEVEQHVRARLPTEVLAKLHDLHARGNPISSDSTFFHFGGDWDDCYIGVLAAIAASPICQA